MRLSCLFICFILIVPELQVRAQTSLDPADADSRIRSKLMELSEAEPEIAAGDWLLGNMDTGARASRKGDETLVIGNGLLSRSFSLWPAVSTYSLKNLATSEEYIRAVKPEAELVIDGISYPVGGMSGQEEQAYLLPVWLGKMNPLPGSFILVDFELKEVAPRIKWKQNRWYPSHQWEQDGVELILHFSHPGKLVGGVEVEIHYELYNSAPLMSKYMVVKNGGDKTIVINHFTSEIIAHPEKNNYVEDPDGWDHPNLYMENDYAFGGFTYAESERSICWERDTAYTSQVNYKLLTPVVLKSKPSTGPEQRLEPGETFESFHTYLLALDGTDLERNSLSKRKMYRILAPWVTENPIFLHLTTTNPEEVKAAIDQCVEVGYEMVILSFGSGLNMEDLSDKNIAKFKALADYAHSRGIELGGYSLFSSRRIDDETDVIDMNTGKPGGAKFLHAPCGGSQWGLTYFASLKEFISRTGFDILEHDGPYPGDFCASENHPGHEGYLDSQWKQWKQSADFYKWLRTKGVYANVPDFYILSGSSKVGIGYREVNWSLPRAQQIILGRQNIYDGTWLRTPSMGWTFVPLTEYHGGGAEATLEPLSEHLDDYQAHMVQNYGSGVQACYRGPRLYDTEGTRELVAENISFYKKYRDILNADIIHLRRPDGRDWDGILHVDPLLEIKGFAMLYNPTDKDIHRKIILPLYYTGLEDQARISVDEGEFINYVLDREYQVELEVDIPARGVCRFRIR